jgi:hypothetical protein
MSRAYQRSGGSVKSGGQIGVRGPFFQKKYDIYDTERYQQVIVRHHLRHFTTFTTFTTFRVILANQSIVYLQ